MAKYRFRTRQEAEDEVKRLESRAWHLEQAWRCAPEFGDGAAYDGGIYYVNSYAPERADQGTILVSLRYDDDRSSPAIYWVGSALDVERDSARWSLPLRCAVERVMYQVRAAARKEGAA